ncbi:MAG: hypothetical protein AAF481_01815 [Acidobacteriota bacterium]
MKKLSFAILLLALVAGPALTMDLPDPQGTECKPLAIDLTAPAIADLLRTGDLLALGTPQVEWKAGGAVKVERQDFVIRDKDGYAIGGGTTTCTGSCAGSSDCTVSGCKAETAGCSHCSCSGIHCDYGCTCKKESSYSPAPAEPGNVPRDRTPTPFF